MCPKSQSRAEREAGASSVRGFSRWRAPTEKRTFQSSISEGITEHKDADEALHHQTVALDDASTTLRVILWQRNRDRAELEQAIASKDVTQACSAPRHVVVGSSRCR
jgi:hypothetical protein